MGLSTAAARGHRADCRTQRSAWRRYAASCRPACCCRGVRAETAGSLWWCSGPAWRARPTRVPRAVNRVRAGSRSAKRKAARPRVNRAADGPSVVRCRPDCGSCRLRSRLAPRPRRLRLPVVQRAGFGLPNLRRNVYPHFYMTGTRGAIPIQAPHLLKALSARTRTSRVASCEGGVHLEQGYVNDVCLTPRFNQCVFYEDDDPRVTGPWLR